MLQTIRDRTSGLVAGFVVAIIVIPLAFWGVESFVSGGGDPVVAKVGDQKIHDSQFRRAYEQRYQQYLQLMGESFRADQFDQARFQQSVLDDMTQESMLRQHAEDAGYRASDAVLFAAISAIPAFQRDGKFDSETYKSALSAQGMTPERFEAQLRQSLEIDQMREAVVESAFMTPVEVKQLLGLATQEREVSVALLPRARYRAQASVSDAELQTKYEETKTQWMAPERIRLAYVELSATTMSDAAAPDAEVLKVLYDAEKQGRFTAPEQRKARHILISFGADKAAAKKKIEDLAAQLKNGGDFAALARSSSDDKGSQATGGDLGWLRRGQMPESFEKSLWSLDKNELSEPVETEFGWHLIRVDEIQAADARSFDDAEVQEELLTLYRNRERQKHFQDLADKVEQLAFENPTSLDAVAAELKLPVQTTEWFTRGGGEGLAAEAAVQQAAFSAEVLKDGENSKPIALGEDRIVVVRKAEYEAPRQRKLEEVADALRTQLLDEQVLKAARADADALLAALRKGEPIAAAAAAHGAEVRELGKLRREDRIADSALLMELFKLPKPQDGKPSFGQVTLGNGDLAVLAFTAVATPAMEASAAEVGRFAQLAAGLEFQAYRAAIAKRIEIELLAPPQSETPVDPLQ